MDPIKITDFCDEHLPQAMQIARHGYEIERTANPALPAIDSFPDLTRFTQQGYGSAAFQGDHMVGFLCFYPPTQDAFGTTGMRGTFSPIHAHGVIASDSSRIYSLLYQSTARKLVRDGILSHSIAIYTHDSEAIRSFFYNGFGLRCIDAVRLLTPLETADAPDCRFIEVPQADKGILLDLQNLLIAHLGKSPTFMPFPQQTQAQFAGKQEDEDVRYFAALIDDKPIAYLKIRDDGENFVCDDPRMVNICGACCQPEYRGTGVSHNLLAYLIDRLVPEGYTRLGVDFESFNPTALGFWLKYFDAYTGSVVRRIDDKILDYS